MSNTTSSIKPKEEVTSSATQAKVDSTFEAIASLTPELVVALCGPIGSPLHETTRQITKTLQDFKYRSIPVRLSEFIRINATVVGIPVDMTNRYSEIDTLIKVGDKLRCDYGNDVLAKIAIAKISADRVKAYGNFSDRANEKETSSENQIQAHRVCHIIDSIKNIDELKLLRDIYGEALFAIGVFSPVEIRKKNLEHLQALAIDDINKLIDTDSGEEFSHGQSVRDTFPQCDFFLRVDKPFADPLETQAVSQLDEKLRRFFKLIFRTSVVSPTSEENAMNSAASAARNSACLSRQVGAAVTSESGDLLAIGWNDVPGSGGGLYGKPPLFRIAGKERGDERCYAQSGTKCHNDLEKRMIAQKIAEALVNKAILKPEDLEGAVQVIIKDSRVKDLIEFSRAVHAEMHAILGASRIAGDRVIGGKVFVTTYPCHSCARHLVAAGISEIYYIEPYRKSLATRLHADALTEAINGNGVKLVQFDGVAPRRFIDIFDSGSRKSETGVLELEDRSKASPSTHVSLRAIPRLEEAVVAEISTTNLQLLELTAVGGTDDQGACTTA
ncbi:zinc-binding CMP/dCMP deaminase [Acidithiobacillus ferrivorans SS3]|uniref:Zinc-binding CMP/dCMP deaminase n=1 Tax=Acidithiobacillus ferrivorans SS3 TaxID=743299 RepID=G0JUG5_9PROT|nr:anti-phage dCTP deaminase [Acidithiobacillus ferrivorans]AEM49134.1 zinc-binding CMP/dCMP deaminase [Acidithiobacillus ferrivorans SS3]